MEVPPSYDDAVSKPDWLPLVVPFVPVSSWTSCCLVDRRFYSHFAPCLWRDPLVTIRRLGLHPNDDIAWYNRFIHKHARLARREVRFMVKSLDFRAFALSASGFYSTEASERAISESFRIIQDLFPDLKCLLLDGHPEIDPVPLGIHIRRILESTSLFAGSSFVHSVELLDLARCCQELPSQFFSAASFRSLVYLDVSYIPGSLRVAIRDSLKPAHLPMLHVLKARGREMDDATAQLLCSTFGRQLWSLDLSDNKLTDDTIESLLQYSFCTTLSMRDDSHFDVEGKLVNTKHIGTHVYGPFEFVEESSSSASFTHPNRYLADAPTYVSTGGLLQWKIVRSDGTGTPRCDGVAAAKRALLQSAMESTRTTPLHLGCGHITHLYLNGNRFTTKGIGKLLRLSSGTLEHLECDQCLDVPSASPMGEDQRQLRVRDISALSHLFRPVFSSNLESLRLHHSLVTRIPDVDHPGLSTAPALKVSETVLFKNISRIYPQSFVPDMNPRITSLTLTDIPARSVGPLIEQITSFLDLASLQQKGIREAARNLTNRRSVMLRGLRHIRLELKSDFADDLSDLTVGADIDYGKLLDPGDLDFSSSAIPLSGDAMQPTSKVARNDTSRANTEEFSHWTSGRLKSAPYSETESHFITYRVEASESMTRNVFSVPVWIGPGTIGPHAAVNEYMWNLQDPKLRTDIGPATPNHVAAGVPSQSYIFYAAWDIMVLPRSLSAVVARTRDVGPLRDVAAAIKEYRMRTKGTADHWDGKLELVRTDTSARYQASEYWR